MLKSSVKQISKILLEMCLTEMAHQISRSHVSALTSFSGMNHTTYHRMSTLPVVNRIDAHITIHQQIDHDGSMNVATLDHSNKRAIHVTNVKFKNKSVKFPHDHLEQLVVDKDSNHHIGQQSGYARNFAYDYWKGQGKPLRSSNDQSPGGHKMWKKYATQALNDGKHVYFHDEADGKFVPIDHENLDHYHQHYFGDQEHHKYRSLVLSHTPLK